MKTEKKYDLLIRVTSRNLTTVIDVLKNAGDLVSINQVDVVETSSKKPKEPRAPRPRPEGRPKAAEVVLTVMKPGVDYHIDQLFPLTSQHGYAEGTIEATCSHLFRNGILERPKPLTYRKPREAVA